MKGFLAMIIYLAGVTALAWGAYYELPREESTVGHYLTVSKFQSYVLHLDDGGYRCVGCQECINEP